MRKSYAGQPVTASEPVFGYQAGLIGLKVRNEKFALAVMNNAEPTPSEVAAFENDLKGRKVKAMLYNAQASEPAVARLVQLARDNGIPVVGVSETEPAEHDLSGLDAGPAQRARQGARRRGVEHDAIGQSRHREERSDAAIQEPVVALCPLDCFAALAMTATP